MGSGTIVDKETNENIVVVAGGNSGDATKSTELLINGEWQQGPQMPKRIHGQAAVELKGDLYTIGGYSPDGGGGTLTTINRLSCTSYVCTWTTINQELKVA